ncbi:hypothetical protein D3C85_1409900 [compost metagenome]
MAVAIARVLSCRPRLVATRSLPCGRSIHHPAFVEKLTALLDTEAVFASLSVPSSVKVCRTKLVVSVRTSPQPLLVKGSFTA